MGDLMICYVCGEEADRQINILLVKDNVGKIHACDNCIKNNLTYMSFGYNLEGTSNCVLYLPRTDVNNLFDNLRQDNCCINRINFTKNREEEQFSIETVNDMCHIT